jgi:tRNA(adenine34) deaminase
MDKCQRIKEAYENTQRGESTNLLRTVLSVADEVGLDQALAYLEDCVVGKRLAWLDANLAGMDRTGDPVLDGYRIFYEIYLGISSPKLGEIVEHTQGKMVTRWWNRCSTLEACTALGLDTRQICRQAYHRPVQAFLSRIHPRLHFERNYEALRPYTPYCEEIISLEE